MSFRFWNIQTPFTRTYSSSYLAEPQTARFAIRVGAGLEQIPDAGGGIAVHLDDGVHHHVDGEGQPVGGVDEEVADAVASFGPAPNAAVPNGVLHEQAGDAVGVVVVVAVGAVAGLEALDFLHVFQDAQPAFDVFQAHGLRSSVNVRIDLRCTCFPSTCHCERSVAISLGQRSSLLERDCHVAALLAMTKQVRAST